MGEPYQRPGRKHYYFEFRDQHGKLRQHVNLHVTDKRIAQQIAREIEEDVERLRAGLPPRHVDTVGSHLGLGRRGPGAVTWKEATEGFLQELERQGSGPGSAHYRDMRCHLAKWSKECGWRFLSDIKTADIGRFLGQLASAGKAPRTQNHYLSHLRQMLGWCVKPQDWLRENPAMDISAVRVGQTGRRRLRRAYTEDEWKRLLAAAPNYRQTIYRVATFSGLRRTELKKLQKQDCTPTGVNPHWHVRPEVTKNGLGAKLPMLPDCADALRPLWEALPSPTSRLFRAIPAIQLLHGDLDVAGIPRQDERGRWADFHSFRYTFCTWMAKRHPIQTVQRLMRHGTITLTADIYNDLDLTDAAEQLWTLNRLFE